KSRAMPIALALSRVSTDDKNASDTNTSVSITPENTSVAAPGPPPNMAIGTPTPTKKAAQRENATAIYSPRKITLRLTGWASISSMNSYELKKCIVVNTMLTRGTTIRTTLRRLSTTLPESLSRLNNANVLMRRNSVYSIVNLVLRISINMYRTIRVIAQSAIE